MSNNKQLPLPPRSSRHSHIFDTSQGHARDHSWSMDAQALLREVKALKTEKAHLVDRIGHLTEENQSYKEALRNIMRYTLITVEDCRVRDKGRQAPLSELVQAASAEDNNSCVEQEARAL